MSFAKAGKHKKPNWAVARTRASENKIPSYADFKKKYGKIPMLILPIKGYWLEKIWSGEKLEEYRNMTPYYKTRLEKYKDFPSFTVGLRAGYSMKSKFAVCLCRLKKGEGFEEWGAEKGKDYYVLQILKVYKDGFQSPSKKAKHFCQTRALKINRKRKLS